jgi:hypothetical protein
VGFEVADEPGPVRRVGSLQIDGQGEVHQLSDSEPAGVDAGEEASSFDVVC